MAQGRTVIVLATGEDEPMKSSLPTVLHPLLGRTLIGHVLAAAGELRATRTVVVVAVGADRVVDEVRQIAPDALAVTLAATGLGGDAHAVRLAVEAAEVVDGTVVVLHGDRALLRGDTVAALVASHESTGAAATILTGYVDTPDGHSRIVRDSATGAVNAMVADPELSGAGEVSGGAYAFDARFLSRALAKLAAAPGDAHITDLLGVLVADGAAVAAQVAADATEVLGCVDRVRLSVLGARLRDRINDGWMRAGVTIVDPASTWIDVTASIGRDSVLEPGTYLRGETSVGEWAVVGPDTTVTDASVGDGAHIVRSQVLGAKIGPRVSVGPYAYLRPGTVLHEAAKVGTFVEVKNSEVGAGTKIPHLSYVGDATIGEGTNIGAANVVVNYDGITKHRTVVGSHVRTGSDTMLVAPVTVGDGAYTAAGSVVTKDVPPGALAVARAQQRNIEGWVEKRRAGTKSAQAAAAAQSATPEAPAPDSPIPGVTTSTRGPRPETQTALSAAGSALESATGDTASD